MTEATFTPQSAYTKAELEACGRGELFGPGNAQLPTDNMLMVDRITHISSEGGEHGRGEILAELDIHPDLWFFDCHFPVTPSCRAAWASMPCGSWSDFSSAGAATRDAGARWAPEK
jgi:hypothetical protein